MFLLQLVLAGLAVASPFSTHVLHEQRDISSSYANNEESKRVDPNAILPIRIALAQSNLDTGYEHLMAISDPRSKNFGKHWSLTDIHNHFAPSEETKDVVKAWLQASGIDGDDISESTSRAWLGIDIPARYAESLFQTEYYETHGSDGSVHIGCDQYHVPAHLSDHIDFVTPGMGSIPLRKRSLPLAPQLQALKNTLARRQAANFTDLPCGELITPDCIRALYDIPLENECDSGIGLGIFEFTDVYDQTDLNLFFKYFAKYIPQGTHPELDSIDGGTAPTNVSAGGAESIIDFTIAFSLLYPQNITLYQTLYTPKQEEALLKQLHGPKENRITIGGGLLIVENLLDAVDGSFCTPAAKKEGLECGTTELTPVLSVSYGSPEINFPVRFAQRACNEYMKLGLKGHTLLFAAGDYGPAGNAVKVGKDPAVSNACINLKEPQNVLVNGTVFNPQFPPTCPYVLAIGGTQLNKGETVKDPESVMNVPNELLGFPDYIHFGSSGGFSNYFKEPSYQSAAVSEWLSKYTPGYKTYDFPGGQDVGANGGLYATGGRAFPDVSGNGAYLASFLDGKFAPNYGTSLPTPIWASLFTRINNERAAMGKGPVGFVNPTLYQNLQIFNDITSGNAPGCDTDGFSAAPGWDPTTGLGTPKYPELREVFLALP